jgi:hypothetical protein
MVILKIYYGKYIFLFNVTHNMRYVQQKQVLLKQDPKENQK